MAPQAQDHAAVHDAAHPRTSASSAPFMMWRVEVPMTISI
jgi:hypothetical protein